MIDKLVTVARYTDHVEADLARQRLEDEDIKAFVMGQNAGIAWGVPPAGGIELQTPESQARHAKEILEAARAPQPDADRESKEDHNPEQE